ncbi:cold-shock protein [Aeromicrobium stalagmiti]|uniref:cold-shock protein n=1 Tax=Aeromicrobium stalagmiti TaxID=2738988 RepID=UPI001569F03F|nr:cold-shock protein [Aeromicrobium stalagmiti]NRQ51348.1 cold-shock protein [Aeromicrobium stalagmiti]
MQGTVASFDQTTGSGHVLTDQGVPLDFGVEALADHIRLLRVGQRVFVETEASGEVTGIAIWPTR